ncbi:unnamed protein product [Oikopleura dioica]|uniref:Uncharacterized protein n=1 Tax=Oikopleura dioica TaxID=34765 RepID=E4XVE0_OIKDI|nr:unnamed protein product [Oikopleura dioica]
MSTQTELNGLINLFSSIARTALGQHVYFKESPLLQYNRDANERIKLSVRGNEEERRVIQIGENTSFANGKNGRERIDIDGAFSSIKSLQLDVIDGLRASIKQLAVENQKIQKERADFRLSVEKLRNDFENDYSSSLSTLRNIEKFVDEKITSSNELLQNQITNLQQSFLYKLNAFEENTINTIQSEQSRLGSELTKLTGRVDSVKLSSGSFESGLDIAFL